MENWKKDFCDALDGYMPSVPDGVMPDVLERMSVRRRRKNAVIIGLCSMVAAASLAVGFFLPGPDGDIAVSPDISKEYAEAIPLRGDSESVSEPLAEKAVVEPSSLGGVNGKRSFMPIYGRDVPLGNDSEMEEVPANVKDEKGKAQNSNPGSEGNHSEKGADTVSTADVLKDGNSRNGNAVQTIAHDGDIRDDFTEVPYVDGRRKKGRVRFAVALSGISGKAFSSNLSSMMMSDSQVMCDAPEDIEGREVRVVGNEYTTDYDHRPPVRVMLLGSYPLGEKISLESGLTYCHTYSDVTKIGKVTQSEYSQNLNYVGIPLGVSYKFLKGEKVSLSVGAGAIAEKMVSGGLKPVSDTHSIKLDSKGVHVCTYCDIDAEVMLTKNVGVSLQPAVGYNFSEKGSDYRSVWDDRPVSFEVRMALRLYL